MREGHRRLINRQSQDATITNLNDLIHRPEQFIARYRLALDAEGWQWKSGKDRRYGRFRWSN